MQKNDYCYWKHNFCRLCEQNPAFELLQIDWKPEKWQLRHNFPTWRIVKFFGRCFFSLFKLSYWSKFHVNIITGSSIMTIFFYKGLIRNPEIGNTPVWVFPNIWRLGWVMDTKFDTNISNRMLLNAAKFQVHSFTVFGLLRENQLGGKGGVKLAPLPPTNIKQTCSNKLKVF